MSTMFRVPLRYTYDPGRKSFFYSGMSLRNIDADSFFHGIVVMKATVRWQDKIIVNEYMYVKVWSFETPVVNLYKS